jgi:NTP pyrophosphatase (non-canonical NTP hydrolase)
MLSFTEYEKIWDITAIYPDRGNNFTYPALKLCGEAGEVAEKLGKIIRDKGGKLTFEDEQEVIKELGDVLWYITALAKEMGGTLEEVAYRNWKKLTDRKDRGVLQGSGDNR